MEHPTLDTINFKQIKSVEIWAGYLNAVDLVVEKFAIATIALSVVNHGNLMQLMIHLENRVTSIKLQTWILLG